MWSLFWGGGASPWPSGIRGPCPLVSLMWLRPQPDLAWYGGSVALISDDPSVVCCPFWTFFDCYSLRPSRQQFPDDSIGKTTSYADDISLLEETSVALSTKSALEAAISTGGRKDASLLVASGGARGHRCIDMRGSINAVVAASSGGRKICW